MLNNTNPRSTKRAHYYQLRSLLSLLNKLSTFCSSSVTFSTTKYFLTPSSSKSRTQDDFSSSPAGCLRYMEDTAVHFTSIYSIQFIVANQQAKNNAILYSIPGNICTRSSRWDKYSELKWITSVSGVFSPLLVTRTTHVFSIGMISLSFMPESRLPQYSL